jgi:hypothetical protein
MMIPPRSLFLPVLTLFTCLPAERGRLGRTLVLGVIKFIYLSSTYVHFI